MTDPSTRDTSAPYVTPYEELVIRTAGAIACGIESSSGAEMKPHDIAIRCVDVAMAIVGEVRRRTKES